MNTFLMNAHVEELPLPWTNVPRYYYRVEMNDGSAFERYSDTRLEVGVLYKEYGKEGGIARVLVYNNRTGKQISCFRW